MKQYFLNFDYITSIVFLMRSCYHMISYEWSNSFQHFFYTVKSKHVYFVVKIMITITN